MIYIIRKEHFNAAHKLYNPLWSKEKNMEEFGVCSNENWHGHNYEIEVTIKGKINPEAFPTSTNTVAISEATTT